MIAIHQAILKSPQDAQGFASPGPVRSRWKMIFLCALGSVGGLLAGAVMGYLVGALGTHWPELQIGKSYANTLAYIYAFAGGGFVLGLVNSVRFQKYSIQRHP